MLTLKHAESHMLNYIQTKEPHLQPFLALSLHHREVCGFPVSLAAAVLRWEPITQWAKALEHGAGARLGKQRSYRWHFKETLKGYHSSRLCSAVTLWGGITTKTTTTVKIAYKFQARAIWIF